MTPPSDDALVELRDLTFGYGERVVLDNISLTLPRGKVSEMLSSTTRSPYPKVRSRSSTRASSDGGVMNAKAGRSPAVCMIRDSGKP